MTTSGPLKARKYQRPIFLDDIISQKVYEKWLSRKASTHVRRDRRRGNTFASITEYKSAIHAAVIQCCGRDAYTGEQLRWDLLSKYDNEQSRKGKRAYKAKFALLPSVDHVGDGSGPANFKICGWRTNDAKNDLSYEDFHSLCKKIVNHYKS